MPLLHSIYTQSSSQMAAVASARFWSLRYNIQRHGCMTRVLCRAIAQASASNDSWFFRCRCRCRCRSSVFARQSNAYTILTEKVTTQLEIKRSKFIAVAGPVADHNAAQSFLEEVRDSRASHNCWAYKLGERYRFSDDGEPGGTAGNPIYSAIVSSGLDRVMVVVIRYFGGIKLGTGGLVRAYRGVALDCLRNAATFVVKPKVAIVLGVPYDLLGNIVHMLQSHGVANLRHEYEESGNCCNITFDVEVDKVDDLEQYVQGSCHGRVTLSMRI